MLDDVNIAIAGLGTVGTGVVKLLEDNNKIITQRSLRKINIKYISCKNKDKKRDFDISKYNLVESTIELAEKEDVNTIIELIGGSSGIAYDLCKKALKNKKNVITANKALIAHHGLELAQLAQENNVGLFFEAAVAGGIPIIKTLKQSLAGNKIIKITGIMNGTCNYILSAMRKTKKNFDVILKEAKELGYAEADPTFDVEGIDAAHKLAILTSIAYGSKIDFSSLYIEGITKVTLEDIKHANQLGYKIKLLAISSYDENKDKLTQVVYPALINKDHPLYNVENVDNAVLVESYGAGKILLQGPGAGSLATASSVLSDIIDIANNNNNFVFNIDNKNLLDIKTKKIDDIISEYYIRLVVNDKSGVLSSIANIFKEFDISLDSLLQNPIKQENNIAHIVAITHKTSETKIKKACVEFNKLADIKEAPHIMRIEN